MTIALRYELKDLVAISKNSHYCYLFDRSAMVIGFHTVLRI